MIFTTSEATGLFIFPFMLTTCENAWDIINETGLIFVPFAILLIVSVMESRAQGEDEGSPAILCIKAIEARGIPMLLVMFLGCIPLSGSSSSSTFRFRAFSCASYPSLVTGVENVSSLKPNTTLGNDYGNSNAPALFGLVNEIGVALNGSAIASINCTQGANRQEMGEILSDIQLSKPRDRYVLGEFNNLCYKPALAKLARYEAAGTTLNVDLTDEENQKPEAFAFNSDLLEKLYDGTIVSPTDSAIKFAVSDAWKSAISSATDDYETCTQGMTDIQNLIVDDLQDSDTSIFNDENTYTKTLAKLKSTINIANGSNYSTSEARNEIIKAVYKNSHMGAYTPLVHASPAKKATDISARALLKKMKWSKFELATKSPDVTISTLSFFGSIWSDLGKNIESMTYFRLAPTLITIIQGFVIAVAPILLLLSGYNPKILLNMLVFYFALSMCPFFMNIGLLLDSVITSLVNSQSDGLQIHNVMVVEMVNLSATTIMIAVPAMWLTMIQLLGIYVGNALDPATSAAGSAGDQALSTGRSFTRSFVNKGPKAIKNKFREATGKETDETRRLNRLSEKFKKEAEKIVSDLVNK